MRRFALSSLFDALLSSGWIWLSDRRPLHSLRPLFLGTNSLLLSGLRPSRLLLHLLLGSRLGFACLLIGPRRGHTVLLFHHRPLLLLTRLRLLPCGVLLSALHASLLPHL